MIISPTEFYRGSGRYFLPVLGLWMKSCAVCILSTGKEQGVLREGQLESLSQTSLSILPKLAVSLSVLPWIAAGWGCKTTRIRYVLAIVPQTDRVT